MLADTVVFNFDVTLLDNPETMKLVEAAITACPLATLLLIVNNMVDLI
jgi:hypothetical protein